MPSISSDIRFHSPFRAEIPARTSVNRSFSIEPKPQMFAHYGRNILRPSSDTFTAMDPRAILAIVIAENVKRLMKEQGVYRNPNALAKAINTPTRKVSANSIAYLFKPERRPKGEKIRNTLPRLETLAHAASKLDCQVWELLHPNLDKLRLKLRAYEAVKDAHESAERSMISAPARQ